MADKEVIREYLIRLGWDVSRKDSEILQDTLKNTERWMTRIGTAGAVTVAGVAVVSNELERLYYSSKRVGATANNIRALEYGAEQIGLSADQARSSLENMSKAWRENPGLRGFLESLGVKTTGKDRVDVLLNFVTELKKMPFYIASQRASLFGIDSETLLMMEQGLDTMKKARDERLLALHDSGVSMDVESEKAKNLNNELRRMNSELDSIKVQMFRDFEPAMRNGAGVIHEVFKAIQDADAATNGWSTRIGAIVVSMGGLAALGRVLGVSLGGAAAGSAGAATGGALAASAGEGVVGYELGKQAAKGNKWAALALASLTGDPALGILGVGGILGIIGTGGAATVPGGDKAFDVGKKLRDQLMQGNLPLGLRQHNPGNLRSWGSTPVQNGFANFASDFDGLSAMAGNLIAYGRDGQNTLSAIINKWAPKSDHNDTNAYIADMVRRTGFGANEVLNLKDASTLQRLMGGIVSHEQGFNPFDNDVLAQAAATRLGAGGGRGAASLNQKTDIHVYGGDPQATARAVAAEQNRVNGDLVRNLSGNMR